MGGIKLLSFFMILVLVLSFANAVDISEVQKGIVTASAMVTDFFANTTQENVVIISGGHISIEDQVLFKMLRSQVNQIQEVQVEPDTYALQNLPGKDLVLIGGAKTNLFTKDYMINNSLHVENQTIISPIILVFGNDGSGRKILILYSQKEVNNNDNKATEKSPLNNILDKKYVPVAATFLSIILLYLWSIFGKTLMNLFSDFSSSKVIQHVTKDKKVKKKPIEHLKLHEFIDISEISALLITTIIFAITMSWSWSSNMSEFSKIFLINLIIIGVISLVREGIRQLMCFRQKLRTEYVFWTFGAIITLISTFLGNTFSMVSYTLLDENVDEKKFGKISFIISFFTFILAIIAYFSNMLIPNLVLQMIFVYSMMILFIELFPMAPMTGNDIRKWNFIIWIIFYAIVTLSYIYMNFTIYI